MGKRDVTDEIFSHEFNVIEDRLVCGGLVGISPIILQSFLSLEKLDIPQFISLLAFSIALPLLPVCLLTVSMRNIDRGDNYPGDIKDWNWKAVLYFIMFDFGLATTFIGVAAAVWHLSWIAAVVFSTMGVICYIVYLVYRGHKVLVTW